LKSFYAEDSLEVGVDEAGRGPLFGRVYVGAAILPPEDFDHSLMRDSKNYPKEKDCKRSIILRRMQLIGLSVIFTNFK
jgi:ribonuclease HII